MGLGLVLGLRLRRGRSAQGHGSSGSSRLHGRSTGKLSGLHRSVTSKTGNWRVTFAVSGKDVVDAAREDDH